MVFRLQYGIAFPYSSLKPAEGFIMISALLLIIDGRIYGGQIKLIL